MLAFTSVYFFESSLFNGLQAIGVKNSLLHVTLSLKSHNPIVPLQAPAWGKPQSSRLDQGHQKHIAHDFVSHNKMRALVASTVATRELPNLGRREPDLKRLGRAGPGRPRVSPQSMIAKELQSLLLTALRPSAPRRDSSLRRRRVDGRDKTGRARRLTAARAVSPPIQQPSLSQQNASRHGLLA
jgi:hypothetical protein